MKTRRQLLHTAAASSLAALPFVLPFISRSSFAQAWPSKSIKLVVPFAPGGSSEIVARATAVELSKTIGQSVFVENKPGAAGNIAMQEVARADDGHTVILGHIGTLAVNPYIFDKLPYDAIKDFKPITLLAKVPSLYLVNADVPAKTLREFVALCKKNPGKYSYGSAGNGSAGHLAMEYLKISADIFSLHVPYRGTGPMLTDLLAGRLEAAAVGAPAVLQHIKSGKLRCLATGSAARIPQLPDVPTVAEQGFAGFEMTQWYGLLAPASMPEANVQKLAAEASKAVRSTGAMERLSADAALAVGGSSADFAKFIAAEQTRWKAVVVRAKIKPD
jgi:tripartite-type tricarboxylate transporter receptor subunit TctC